VSLPTLENEVEVFFDGLRNINKYEEGNIVTPYLFGCCSFLRPKEVV